MLQIDFSKGRKVLKFLKFSGDTTDSTIEHVTRYLTVDGDIANNEKLKIRYFPSTLTKNDFTWFTILPPNSIHDWAHLKTKGSDESHSTYGIPSTRWKQKVTYEIQVSNKSQDIDKILIHQMKT